MRRGGGGVIRSEKEEIDILRNFIKSCDIYLRDEETARTLADNWKGEINKPTNLRFIENAVPVVLCANDDFAPYSAVMLQSLLDNSSPQRKYHFVIFQRGFSSETKESLFKQSAKFPHCAIDFVDLVSVFDKIPILTTEPRFSVDTYSRLLIPYWLDKYPKVIYLDSDMIAKADIAELYDLDIKPFCIAAAIDPLGECVNNKFYNPNFVLGVFANLENWRRYFNSGVLVFDTQRFREKISCADLFRFAIYYSNRYKRRCNDQDVLNLLFNDDYFILPPLWNDMWLSYDKNGRFSIRFAIPDYKILHFIVSPKPWELSSEIENNPDVSAYRGYAETVESFRKYYYGEKRYFDFDKLNKSLAESKNVHFMINEKFTNTTIDFINKHFSSQDNLFLVRRVHPLSFTAQKFPKGENVIEFDYGFLDTKNFVNKKLVFHSLHDISAVNWLYDNPRLLKHSYWVPWGGDIRNAPSDEASVFVRRNIYGICSNSSANTELIKEKYGGSHKFINCNLTVFPTHNFNKLIPLRNGRIKNDAFIIQVNVSAQEKTLEMLDVLAKYKNENILIKTVLSYSRVDLSQDIINKGKEIFGDKFSYMDKMILPNDYIEYLAQNDILIINDTRGGGNISTSLMLGKKVFVTSEFRFNEYYRENGIKVFDPNEIKDMDFRTFCEISRETIENNIKKTEDMFSEERKKSDYVKFFDDKSPALNSEKK